MQLKTKLNYTAAIVAAALSMATISTANAASVTINNAGFEKSFDNWEDTDPSSISGDENTGSKSAKITGSSGKFEQSVSVEKNTNYTLTAYVKGSGKIGATVDGTNYTSTGGGDDYELVSVSFNSGSETSITIFGNYYNDEGRFDDFALESTSTSSSNSSSTTDFELTIDKAFDDGSSHSKYPASNAKDNNTDWPSRWAAENDGGAVNLTMQLEETADVTKVGVAWGRGENRTHTFEIYARPGTSGSWTKIYDSVSSGNSKDIEIYDVTNISAQQIRIKAQKNSANSDWMNITEVKVYGDSSRSSTPIIKEPTPETPSPIVGNCNIDMSIWGYTTGNGKSMNDVDDIQDLVDNKTLGSNGEEEIIFNDGCVTFKVANDAASSGGSTFPRSELRELIARYDDNGDAKVKGLTKNNWVTSEASSSNQNKVGGVNGNLKATLIVNKVSVDATSDDQIGRIIVGQIHGEDHEPVKIYYRKLPEHNKGSVFFTVDDSSGNPGDRINIIGFTDKNDTDEDASGDPIEPSNGIALGDEWSYEIDLTGDQLQVTVWHNGYTYTTADSIEYTKTRSKQLIRNSDDTDAITISDFYADDYMYFKAGLYNQNKTGTESPDYASVTFKAIDVEH